MRSYNPAIPEYTLQDYWMVAKDVNKKNAGKPSFWWLMLFYTDLMLLLQPSVLWLSIVIFNNDAKLWPKWIFREFSIANPTPARWVTPPWNVYMAAKFDPGWEGCRVWQTGLPALAGHPTYHVNVIKLKREIIWTGGYPTLAGYLTYLGSPTSM